MRQIEATPEEIEKVAEAYHRATTTPAIIMRTGDRSMADVAWDDLRACLRELGAKYDFDPDGEVVSIKDGKLSVMTFEEAQSLEE